MQEAEGTEKKKIEEPDIEAILAKDKAELKKKLVEAYASWANILLSFRSFILWDSPKTAAISFSILLVVHLILWYGSLAVAQLGLLTVSSIFGIVLTVAIWASQKLGFQFLRKFETKKSTEPKEEVKPVTPVAETDQFSFEQLIHKYVEVSFAAERIKQQIITRVTSDASLSFTMMIRIVLILVAVAIIGQVLSGFWIVWFCTFFLLLAPGFYARGWHEPLVKRLQPHADKATGFIGRQLDSLHKDQVESLKKDA